MIVYMQVGTRGVVQMLVAPDDAEGGVNGFVRRFRDEFARLYSGVPLRQLGREPGGAKKLMELRDRFSRCEMPNGAHYLTEELREYIAEAAKIHGGSELPPPRNPHGDAHKRGPKPEGRWVVKRRAEIRAKKDASD